MVKQYRTICIPLLFTFCSFTLYSQQSEIEKLLTTPRKVVDCELVSLNAADEIYSMLNENKLDSFNLIINEWIKLCGISECTQRLIVLKTILNSEPSIDSIKKYFSNDFHYRYRYRMNVSNKTDYGFMYARNKEYYGYVSLRHPIDSISMRIAYVLLNSRELTADERLICILFQGDIDKFDEALKKHEFSETFIKNYIKEKDFEFRNSWIACNIYGGIYSTIGNKNIFTNLPTFGFTFSSPLKYDVVVELGIKFRININDKEFDYYAFDKINNVNSDMSVFFGGLVGYKVFENKYLTLMPKVGLGIESVSTGLSQKKENSTEKDYFDAETVHLSVGISAMKPIQNMNYIGLEINYHYCPYHLDENLLTEFDSRAISCELFYRF